MPTRPRSDQPHYGAHLGDASYWGPFVLEVIDRHALRIAPVEAPFVGTFPTFLVGDVVVKLFGAGYDGRRSFDVERAMHHLLEDHPSIPAPSLIALGHLYGDDAGWSWPYLVTERVAGQAIREAEVGLDDGRAIASALGASTAVLHRLPPPAAVLDRGLLPELRADAPGRLARFGLPAPLVEQAGQYLADAEPATVLVHADITADHVFVAGSRLVALIDWGDALVADREYELVAVAFDALKGRPELLAAFVDGYGWPVDAGFPRRALQAVLEFQFNAIAGLREVVDLDRVRTLDELADLLFGQLVDVGG